MQKMSNIDETGFSVLLPVCNKERPEWLNACLESLFSQTRPASEILIVKDGALSFALCAVINQYAQYSGGILRVMQVPGGQDLGELLRQGVLACRFPLIARMDADDVCMPFRFERQLRFLEAHPSVDIVGSNMLEMRQGQTVCRRVPEHMGQIRAFSHWRNPFCHMTVLFRREAVLGAGNYRSCLFFEDYDLWVRMLQCGAKGYNLQENLVRARADGEERRGGTGYFQAEICFFKQLLRSGYLHAAGYLAALSVRGAVRIMPKTLRDWFYCFALRQHERQFS